MSPTDTQRQIAFAAALYALHERPRLINLRASGRLILVTLALPGGALCVVRAATADEPAFDALPERERSRVRSAFLALHSQHGGDNAAA